VDGGPESSSGYNFKWWNLKKDFRKNEINANEASCRYEMKYRTYRSIGFSVASP
jgi:hypothetical protein